MGPELRILSGSDTQPVGRGRKYRLDLRNKQTNKIIVSPKDKQLSAIKVLVHSCHLELGRH